MTAPLTVRPAGTTASNAQADSLCQGRYQAQLGLPDVSSPDAQFGQQIHAALATGVIEGLDTQQLSIYESCLEIRDKLMKQAFGAEAGAASVFKEKRLYCVVKPGDFQHSGMPDEVARIGPKALIIEFKCLPGDLPDSPSNLQLRDQCVLAARAYALKDVAVAIVQPLVTHDPQVCVYTVEDIDKAEQEMFARVVASNAKDAPRTAGEVQCKFCKAKGGCKEYAAWAKTMLPAPVSIFDVPVAQWSPEQRATFCERMGFAAKWLEDGKDAMKKLLKADPNTIPGWTLEEGATRATITNPQEVFNRFIAKGGTTEQFLACIKVAKEPLTAAMRAITKAKGKGLLGEMEKLLAGTYVEKKDEPSLGRRKG